MKPNFTEMTVSELRAYVLEHREDDEAIRALFHHPSLQWVTMPPMFTEDGQPIEENIRQAEKTLRQHFEQENK
ncbi:MAG: hypothetical protein MUD14_23180 [Hydrococcus sp. Prado102]|jgi:hypothetical protein|nr:hypothetical protein [Hydrococcus sp. Prado102]